MSQATKDTWGDLRAELARGEFASALYLALTFEALEQLAALHHVARAASVATFDPDEIRELARARGWTIRAARVIPMIPAGPMCEAYADPTNQPRLRRQFAEVGRFRWSPQGARFCLGAGAWSDPRALFAFELSCGLRYATFEPNEAEWSRCAPSIGPWHKHDGDFGRVMWARAIVWGRSRLIEEVSFSSRLRGGPRVDLIPAETIADRSYNPTPTRNQSAPQELYITARELQTGTPPEHWTAGAPGAALLESSPFPLNQPASR